MEEADEARRRLKADFDELINVLWTKEYVPQIDKLPVDVKVTLFHTYSFSLYMGVKYRLPEWALLDQARLSERSF